MGYVIHPRNLERMREHLGLLASGEPCAWAVEGNASNFAFLVRQALRVAQAYPDLWPELAANAERFVIEVVNPDRVQARVARNRFPAATLVHGAPSAREVPNHGLEPHGVHTLVAPANALQVIDLWRKRQPSNDPVHFPKHQLDTGELRSLYEWCQRKTPRLMILAIGDALTIAIEDPDALPAAWTPGKETHPHADSAGTATPD